MTTHNTKHYHQDTAKNGKTFIETAPGQFAEGDTIIMTTERTEAPKSTRRRRGDKPFQPSKRVTEVKVTGVGQTFELAKYDGKGTHVEQCRYYVEIISDETTAL